MACCGALKRVGCDGKDYGFAGATSKIPYTDDTCCNPCNKGTQLPSIANPQITRGSCELPLPCPKRTLTTLPWRPSVYYQSSKVNPCTAITQCTTKPKSKCTQITEMECNKIPPVFASARNALYTRFTHHDWTAATEGTFRASDRVLGGAERLRLDTCRLAREYEDRTKRTQGDVNKRLGERIEDIHFWRNELNHELDNMITEINLLNEAKRILEKNLCESENPLHISQECLYSREKRQCIELVHDQPEKELINEVDIIKRCQERMKCTVERANCQLGLNRAAQHELERDSGDKFLAENLDNTSKMLRNSSRGLTYHDGVHCIDNTITVPETWAKYTNDNIKRSQSERAASKALRNEIECVINTCYEEMWKVWNAVNTALCHRIQETTNARNKIQSHLRKNLQEMFDMEKDMEFLKKCIKDSEDPMRVAQTRLGIRLRRPCVELCRDPAHTRLVEEVCEITETVEHLQCKLREAENALQALLRTKGALEQDLSIKNNTLFIDREKCLAMRKTFPIGARCVTTTQNTANC